MQQREIKDSPSTSSPPVRAKSGVRPLVALFLIAGLAGAAWHYGWPLLPNRTAAPQAAPPPPPQVTVAKPTVKPVVETQEFTGRFAASDTVDLRSRLSGYLEAIHVPDGALVKKGELLFTIDQRPTRYAIEQADAAIRNAQPRIEFAQADLARAETLRRSGTTPLNIAEQRQRDLAVAQGDLQSAQAAAGRARLDLAYTQIAAPFAGRISRKNVSVGNLIKADDTVLTTLVADDPIYFYFDVDERSVLESLRSQITALSARTSLGKLEVSITLTDQVGEPIKGVLDFTDNRLDEASGTLRTRAVVPNPDHTIRPGLFGRIRIPKVDSKPAVLVPDAAIGSDQDRRIVYVITPEQTAKATTVTLGPRIEGLRVIRSGLTGEETIVVNGLVRVRPGAKVAPKEAAPVPAGSAVPPAPAVSAPATKG